MRFLLDSLLAISPVERGKLTLAFLYAFCTAGAYVVGRSAADALFLARVGPRWLPLMYLVSACSLGLISVAVAQVAARISLKRLVGGTLLVLGSSSVVLCLVVQRWDHAVALLGAIYLLAEVRGALNSIQYGILVNELFSSSPAFPHATALLGAAATLAGITLGAFVAFEVHQLGTAELLYVAAGLELLALSAIAWLPRSDGERSADQSGANDAALAVARFEGFVPFASASGLSTAARSRYVRGIAALVGVTVIAATMVEFQWKASVATSFATREDQMAGYFGMFHASVGLLAGTIQVLLTGRLLRIFGSRPLLIVFPTLLATATCGVLAAAWDRVLLVPITLAKGCDVVKRSLNSPAILMLYAPLDNGPRRHAITLVAGIVKPSAEAAAALLIVVLTSGISIRSMSYIILALLAVLLWLVARQPSSEPARQPRTGANDPDPEASA